MVDLLYMSQSALASNKEKEKNFLLHFTSVFLAGKGEHFVIAKDKLLFGRGPLRVNLSEI